MNRNLFRGMSRQRADWHLRESERNVTDYVVVLLMLIVLVPAIVRGV